MPNWMTRLAAKATSMIFPGSGRAGRGHVSMSSNMDLIWPANAGNLRSWTPSDIDWEGLAGDPLDNSAVAICLSRITDAFGEPTLEVVEQNAKGVWEAVKDHPAPGLLGLPNVNHDMDAIWTATINDYKTEGNGYWVKIRNAAGKLRELWWVPFYQMRVVPSEDPRRLIAGYEFRPSGADPVFFPPEDVIHFRHGICRHNWRLGEAPLKKVLREVATDNVATIYSAGVLNGYGVIGGVLTNEDEHVELDEAAVERLQALHRTKFGPGGRNAGGLLIPTFKAKYQEVGKSPEEMAIDSLRAVPEARICAALGVPAMVAGLSVGNEQRTYANYAEAREAFYEDCLMPLQKRIAAALTRYLLPEFGDDPQKRRFRWNYEEVRVLRPDMDKESARTVAEWQANLITLNEAREKVGEDAVEGEEGNAYFAQHTAAMQPEPQNTPQVAQEGQEDAPESAGDRMASNERTPPFAAEKSLNGHARKAEEAAQIKAELASKWRTRRRQQEENADGD